MHEMAGGTSKVNQYIYCKISSFLAEGLTIYSKLNSLLGKGLRRGILHHKYAHLISAIA